LGPTLGSQAKIISFAGVKGGTGCSVLSSLLARLAAKKGPARCGLLDALPISYSPVPSFLAVPSPGHFLSQLKPYQDHLSAKMVESFFSVSPEKCAYIPLSQGDEQPLSALETFSLVEKLSSWFDYLFLDLSAFADEARLAFLEKSHFSWLLSSLDALSLSHIAKWQKRLLSAHLDLNEFGVILNQTFPEPSAPKETGAWTKNFRQVLNVPYLGGDLALGLLEGRPFPPTVEKLLSPLLEKLLDPASLSKKTAAPAATEGTDPAGAPGPVSLEQVHQLHQKLLDHLRESGFLKDPQNTESQRQTLEPQAREILDQLIQQLNVSDRETRKQLVVETLHLAFGLGPLEPLLQDAAITEIMVNGPSQIYVEKKGLLEKTGVQFMDDQQLRTVIERVLAPIGRRIDESQPYVDGRLLDGSRVNAIIPPLSLVGPVLTIRKFSKRKLTVDDLVRLGSLSQEAADFLGACVRARKNIVVSGGTGSGKTTLLNILSNFIPPGERIVTIEDSAELQLAQDHVVRLETRPANLEGKGQVSIRDLVINALRMRPDRIVVGECRGGEALDMLQAMNTGHDGSLTTAHANTPRDVLSRLETMCLFSGLELPMKAIREQIARAVHLVVQQNRLANGKRGVTHISEIQGMEGDVILLQDLFIQDGDQGLIRKPFAPSFITDLKSIGYRWPGHEKTAAH